MCVVVVVVVVVVYCTLYHREVSMLYCCVHVLVFLADDIIAYKNYLNNSYAKIFELFELDQWDHIRVGF